MKLPRIDFDRMEREILHETPPQPPITYAPVVEPNQYTAIQIIAHGITQLRWKDAEEMGNAIRAKFPNGTLADGASLTSAIQSWAEEWESFK